MTISRHNKGKPLDFSKNHMKSNSTPSSMSFTHYAAFDLRMCWYSSVVGILTFRVTSCQCPWRDPQGKAETSQLMGTMLASKPHMSYIWSLTNAMPWSTWCVCHHDLPKATWSLGLNKSCNYCNYYYHNSFY